MPRHRERIATHDRKPRPTGLVFHNNRLRAIVAALRLLRLVLPLRIPPCSLLRRCGATIRPRARTLGPAALLPFSGRRLRGLPRSWGTHMCVRRVLRPRWNRLHQATCGAATRPPSTAKARAPTVDKFEAQSHGLRTRCRFARTWRGETSACKASRPAFPTA